MSNFKINGFRYYYNIDRGLSVNSIEIDISKIKLEYIDCVSIQCNIPRAFLMYTAEDTIEKQLEFKTDCQTKIAQSADDVHTYAHQIKNQLKQQGFPIEFFTVKRKGFNDDSNPFLPEVKSDEISMNRKFFILTGNEPLRFEPTFRPFTNNENLNMNADKIIKK